MKGAEVCACVNNVNNEGVMATRTVILEKENITMYNIFLRYTENVNGLKTYYYRL